MEDQRAARSTVAAAAVAIAAAIAGCTGQLAGDTPTPAGDIPTTGNALIVPIIPEGFSAARFEFTVGGNGIDAITGILDASPTSGSRVVVTDLPPGSGYLVSMHEPSGCTGAANFTIEAAQTAAVKVEIMCPHTLPGTTVIPGTIDQCPSITGLPTSSTHAAIVGVPVAIAVSAQDLDATDVVTYAWSETASPPLGAFADASAADTTFTCATTGTTTLSISVSDGICGDTMAGAIALDCLAPAGD